MTMTDIVDLYTLKAKSDEVQRQIINKFVELYLKSGRTELQVRIKEDNVIDLSKESQEQIIQLCVLTIFFSDISKAMDADLRKMYIVNFKLLLEGYGLHYDKVVYLLKYVKEFTDEINLALGNNQKSILSH